MEQQDDLSHIVYSKNVIEFVTVANNYCEFMESTMQYSRRDFVTVTSRILPLLYLKALLLPKVENMLDDAVEQIVDEITYSTIQQNISDKLGAFNDYLEVFTEDMKYSDAPIIAFIAEDLTDIYQDVKNFVSAYRIAVTEIMNDALADVINNFELYWGQKLVNTQRAIHNLLYSAENLDDGENIQENSENKSSGDRFIERL